MYYVSCFEQPFLLYGVVCLCFSFLCFWGGIRGTHSAGLFLLFIWGRAERGLSKSRPHCLFYGVLASSPWGKTTLQKIASVYWLPLQPSCQYGLTCFKSWPEPGTSWLCCAVVQSFQLHGSGRNCAKRGRHEGLNAPVVQWTKFPIFTWWVPKHSKTTKDGINPHLPETAKLGFNQKSMVSLLLADGSLAAGLTLPGPQLQGDEEDSHRQGVVESSRGRPSCAFSHHFSM